MHFAAGIASVARSASYSPGAIGARNQADASVAESQQRGAHLYKWAAGRFPKLLQRKMSLMI